MQILIWLYDWGYRVAWAIAALSVPFFIYSAIMTAPASQQIAQDQRRADVAREDQAFCVKRGLLPGSSGFATCATDLRNIRREEDRRTAREVRDTY